MHHRRLNHSLTPVAAPCRLLPLTYLVDQDILASCCCCRLCHDIFSTVSLTTVSCSHVSQFHFGWLPGWLFSLMISPERTYVMTLKQILLPLYRLARQTGSRLHTMSPEFYVMKCLCPDRSETLQLYRSALKPEVDYKRCQQCIVYNFESLQTSLRTRVLCYEMPLPRPISCQQSIV